MAAFSDGSGPARLLALEPHAQGWPLFDVTVPRGLDHSPVPLLTKPFNNEQLLAMARSVLEVSAAS